MFCEKNYDPLSIFAPSKGMNRNIAPEILPPEYAYYIENMIIDEAGRLTIRYGSSLWKAVSSSGNFYDTLNAFPFVLPNGGKQIILYTRYYETLAGLSDLEIIDDHTLRFSTPSLPKLEKDTPIRFVIQGAYGQANVDTVVRSFLYDEENELVTITTDLGALDAEANLLNVIHVRGEISIFDVASESILPDVGYSDLSAGCVPGCENYLNTALIYNGVDPVFTWDGTTFGFLYEFVKEAAATNASFNRTDNTHFSLTVNPARFKLAKYSPFYFDDQALIQLVVDGALSNLTVTNAALVGSTLTLTTSENLPAFTGQNRCQLFYRDVPPPFCFIKSAHNRLWALGPGPVSLEYRADGQALLVYTSFRVRSITQWFNEETKTIPVIDLSSKYSVPDNLEFITTVGNYLLFIGRRATQVFSGVDPLTDSNANSLAWVKRIDTGCIHPQMILNFPNETSFVSEDTFSTFSTLNVTGQVQVKEEVSIRPFVQKSVAGILNDNILYRACRAFRYTSGQFCGIKIGKKEVLVGRGSVGKDKRNNFSFDSWSVFTGDFESSTCFLSDLDSFLYLFIGNKIYYYGDGKGIAKSYGDRGGAAGISFLWTTPLMNTKARKFLGLYCQFLMDYSSSIPVNKDNNLNITIRGNYRKSFIITKPYTPSYVGDNFDSTPFYDGPLGNDGLPDPLDAIGFRLDYPTYPNVMPLNFLANRFFVDISGYVINGPLSFSEIKLFGRLER